MVRDRNSSFVFSFQFFGCCKTELRVGKSVIAVCEKGDNVIIVVSENGPLAHLVCMYLETRKVEVA